VAITYNNNNGNYFQIFSKFIVIQVNSWETTGKGPVMWSYDNAHPSVKTCRDYVCGSVTGTAVWAYVRTEFNVIGGINNSDCGCGTATGSGTLTTTSAIQEQTNLVNTTAGITFYLGNGYLSGFVSACPDSDNRVYTGNDGYIKIGGVSKLVFNSYRTVMSVNYTTGAITSTGWAKINAAASDPLWVKEFDPFSTGQVVFDAVSSSPVVQQCYGAYDITIKIKPSQYVYNQSAGSVLSEGNSINETVNLSASEVSYNFTAASYGGVEGNGVFANQIMTTPAGSLPVGIDAVSNLYWSLSTALDTFTCSLTFDLSHVTGISNTANLRILKREDSYHPWITWGSYTLVDGTHLRADNVTTLSEWAIGSTGGNALPVELVLFTAVREKSAIILKWNTATELNSFSFEIERNIKDCGCEWEKIGSVPANGNSNSYKNYEFKDVLTKYGSYIYRLKMMDNDGRFDYSKEVNVDASSTLDYTLSQNYPNPFNPITKIEYTLPVAGKVIIKVYNANGEEVADILNEDVSAGYYQIEFDASSLASGVYFDRISASNFVQIKKMLLIK